MRIMTVEQVLTSPTLCGVEPKVVVTALGARGLANPLLPPTKQWNEMIGVLFVKKQVFRYPVHFRQPTHKNFPTLGKPLARCPTNALHELVDELANSLVLLTSITHRTL